MLEEVYLISEDGVVELQVGLVAPYLEASSNPQEDRQETEGRDDFLLHPQVIRVFRF